MDSNLWSFSLSCWLTVSLVPWSVARTRQTQCSAVSRARDLQCTGTAGPAVCCCHALQSSNIRPHLARLTVVTELSLPPPGNSAPPPPGSHALLRATDVSASSPGSAGPVWCASHRLQFSTWFVSWWHYSRIWHQAAQFSKQFCVALLPACLGLQAHIIRDIHTELLDYLLIWRWGFYNCPLRAILLFKSVLRSPWTPALLWSAGQSMSRLLFSLLSAV